MNFKQLMFGMSVLAFLSSCSNDEMFDNDVEKGGKIVFNLPKFKTAESASKTRTSLDVETMTTTWSRTGEETIGVFAADNTSGIQLPFTINSSAVNYVGKASAFCPFNSDWGMKNGVSYVAYYPYYQSLASTKRMYINMRSKAIVSNELSGSVDISNFDVMYAGSKEYENGIVFDFERKYGLLSIKMTNIPDKTWKKIRLSTVSGSSLAVSGYLDLVTGTYQNVTKASYYSIYQGTGVKNSEMNIIFPLLECTTGDLVCTFESTDGTVYKVNLTGAEVQEGSYTQWIVDDMQEVEHIESDLIESIAADEYVDMGDGLMWATKNLGANSPLECGHYFAWGEVAPKNNYSEDNYRFYSFIMNPRLPKSSTKNVWKYNTRDLRYDLETEDDAAHAYLGDGWRMPTVDEVDWLIENSTVQYVYYYNMVDYCYGYLLTSQINGKQLFFPEGCIELYRNELRHLYAGDNFNVGNYWTSSHAAAYNNLPYDESETLAIPYFNVKYSYDSIKREKKFGCNWDGYERHYPALIRAVYDGANK